MTQIKGNFFLRISFILLLAVLLLLPIKAGAEDAPNDTDQQPTLDNRKSPDAAPTIKTTVTVRSYSFNIEEASTDDRPASGLIYEKCYANEKEVDRIEAAKKAISDETVDAAWAEVHELAKELIKNGKYKEMTGYDNMYINMTIEASIPFGDIYDDMDPDDPDEIGPPAPDPKTPYTSGAYYEYLTKKYPHIWNFHFLNEKELEEMSEKKGAFWFAYYIDYSSIDQSKANYTELANTFKVSEQIEISGLEPDREYFPTVKILQLNDDGSTSEVTSTDKVSDNEWYSRGENTSFKTNSNGAADLLAVFDNLELDNNGKYESNYVVTVDIKQSLEDSEPILSHYDLTDTRESFNIFYELDDSEKYRTDKGEEISSYGKIKLSDDTPDLGKLKTRESGGSSDSGKPKSPDTGDATLHTTRLYSILFLLSVVAMTAIIVNKKRHKEGVIR